MNMNVSTMSKEDIIVSIQQTINMFQQDLNNVDDLLFTQDSLDFTTEHNIDLKKQLESLVIQLRKYKEDDNKLYSEIIESVKNIEPFAKRVNESLEMKKFVEKSVISSDTNVNARQLANIMKSSDIFDFINRDKKEIKDEDFKVFGDAAPYVQILWKQVKQEELLGLLLYVNSGKAAKDFSKLNELNYKSKSVRDDFLYAEFKRSFYHLKLKDSEVTITEKSLSKENKVSSAYYMDYGVIVNQDKKELHFGFATANFDTSTQRKQYYEMLKGLKNYVNDESSPYFGYELKPIYITNSIVNENELKFGQSEKQKPFLSTFAEELTRRDRNTLNTSAYLSMFNNVSHNDIFMDLSVTDLLKANPYISGADTFHLYDKFNKISQMPENIKALELRNYLLDSASDLLDVIDKVHEVDGTEDSMHYIHGMIFQNFKNIFTASKNNFVGLLCEEDFLDDYFIVKAEKVLQRAADIHLNKFMGLEPAKNGGLSDFFANQDIKSSMKSIYNQFKKVEAKRSNINQLPLSLEENSEKINIEKAKKMYTRIMPLLKEMKVFSETQLYHMMDYVPYLYNEVKNKPALQNIKDILNASDESRLKDLGKNYNKIVKSDAVYVKKQTQREILRTIFENIRNLDELEESIVMYHKDYMQDMKSNKIKGKI